MISSYGTQKHKWTYCHARTTVINNFKNLFDKILAYPHHFISASLELVWHFQDFNSKTPVLQICLFYVWLLSGKLHQVVVRISSMVQVRENVR
jgi:hypothetical protein